MTELERLQKRVQEIDAWIDEYEGDNEELIDKKLDQQKVILTRISMIRNVYVLSQ